MPETGNGGLGIVKNRIFLVHPFSILVAPFFEDWTKSHFRMRLELSVHFRVISHYWLTHLSFSSLLVLNRKYLKNPL